MFAFVTVVVAAVVIVVANARLQTLFTLHSNYRFHLFSAVHGIYRSLFYYFQSCKKVTDLVVFDTMYT